MITEPQPAATRTRVSANVARSAIARYMWVLLPGLSLIWLAGKLWASHGQIHSSGGGTVALATAADALPGVVQATLVAGIGLALLLAVPFGRPTAGARRWITSLLAGVAAGALTGLAIALAYPHLPALGTIIGALVVAGIIGGTLAAIERIRSAATAGLAATLAALAAITFLNSNVVLSHMLRWFGAGTTAASYVHASSLVQYADYLMVGIVAGLIAFTYLRSVGVRLFPIYLLSGALPGILLLVAFGLTTIGGHRLLSAANALSEADRIVNGMESSETVPNALIVVFVGAFVALIAFGRTLKPASKVPASKVPASPTQPDKAPAQRATDG